MYRLKDRIVDWFNNVGDRLQLAPWAQIGITVAIALVLTGIIVGGAMCGVKGRITEQGEDLAGDIAGIEEQASDNMSAIEQQVQAASDNMELQLDNMREALSGNVTRLWRRIMDGEDWLAEHEEALGGIVQSRLTGEFGNYTLHVTAGAPGNYTAVAHLLYSPIVGNATSYAGAVEDFYAGVDWALPGVPGYICTAGYNGAAWGVAEVRFIIGSFTVEENTELEVDVPCTGLNLTWAPAYMYVDVFKVG